MNRRAAERFVAEVLAELDLRVRVREAIPKRHRAETLIAIGKAAPAMTKGALERLDAATVVVVVPDGTATLGLERDPRVEIHRASHPIPDARSVKAGERCLAVAAEAASLLVLVSGGASALACAPAISLRDKQRVTKALLASGARIDELNVVRKHLSRIKGGGLARAFGGPRLLTLAASDVIGGVASDIGSGPSVSDASTVAAARALLDRYAPSFASLPLVRTGAAPGRAKIIASPEEMARVAGRKLASLGLAVRVLEPSTAPATALADEYLALAKRMAGGTAFVRAAEPSVAVKSKRGRGGRSTHTAALVGRGLPPGITFLAAASDGVDGASGTAGACVRAGFATADAIDASLRAFATGKLHDDARTALRSRPTGHNLADLHILLRA